MIYSFRIIAPDVVIFKCREIDWRRGGREICSPSMRGPRWVGSALGRSSPLPVAGEAEPQFAARGLRRGPLRLRGYSQPFAPLGRGNLLVQLRALLGVNVRAELVLYLLTHESGHAAEMARATCYHKRTVQQVLGEMNRSGIVEVRETGREKHYWIRAADWKGLLRRPDELPLWRTWPPRQFNYL